MKKKVWLTLFSFLGLVSMASAQISIGPKIGIGLSTFRDVKIDESSQEESVIGKHQYKAQVIPELGIVLNAQLGNHFAIRPELLFSQRAFSYDYSRDVIFFNTTYNYNFKGKQSISYLELPIHALGSIHAGPGNIEVFAGGSVAYVLGGKGQNNINLNSLAFNYENSYSVKGGEQYNDFDLYNHPNQVFVNPWNFGLDFGAGYKFDNGLFLQFAYKLGLSNMTAHSSDSAVEDKRNDRVTKSSAFTLGVGYLFGGKE